MRLGGNHMTLSSELARIPGHVGLYAKNLDTQKIIAWHESEVFASASLIKVPILAELFRRVEEEGLNLDETLTLHQEDQVPGSGVLKDLTTGTRYPLRDLATLMITVSDNTATNLLIDYLGIEPVNALIRRLGLLHTALERRLERVPVQRRLLNRTTAYDMTRLMELIAQGQVIAVAASSRMVDLLARCQAPQALAPFAREAPYIGSLPPIRVAHKTGSLAQARHDSGIIYTQKGVLVATIMTEGAPESVLQKHLYRIGRALYSQLSR